MKRESAEPPSGFGVGRKSGRASVGRERPGWHLLPGISRGKLDLFPVPKGTVVSSLRLAGRAALSLFKLGLAALFFSLGILRVTVLMAFQLCFNLCIAVFSPALIFAPAHTVLALVFLTLCLLVVTAHEA